jgi:branched-subunit amino acid ABC-type transport system permease component
VRAGVDDHETVAAMGIDAWRASTPVCGIGAPLVGFAGGLGGVGVIVWEGTPTELNADAEREERLVGAGGGSGS